MIRHPYPRHSSCLLTTFSRSAAQLLTGIQVWQLITAGPLGGLVASYRVLYTRMPQHAARPQKHRLIKKSKGGRRRFETYIVFTYIYPSKHTHILRSSRIKKNGVRITYLYGPIRQPSLKMFRLGGRVNQHLTSETVRHNMPYFLNFRRPCKLSTRKKREGS